MYVLRIRPALLEIILAFRLYIPKISLCPYWIGVKERSTGKMAGKQGKEVLTWRAKCSDTTVRLRNIGGVILLKICLKRLTTDRVEEFIRPVRLNITYVCTTVWLRSIFHCCISYCYFQTNRNKDYTWTIQSCHQGSCSQSFDRCLYNRGCHTRLQERKKQKWLIILVEFIANSYHFCLTVSSLHTAHVVLL